MAFLLWGLLQTNSSLGTIKQAMEFTVAVTPNLPPRNEITMCRVIYCLELRKMWIWERTSRCTVIRNGCRWNCEDIGVMGSCICSYLWPSQIYVPNLQGSFRIWQIPFHCTFIIIVGNVNWLLWLAVMYLLIARPACLFRQPWEPGARRKLSKPPTTLIIVCSNMHISMFS